MLMKHQPALVLWSLLIFSLALTSGGPLVADPAFTIAGSGSNLPLTQKLLDGWTSNRVPRLVLPASIGTSGAIKAVLAGKVTLGLASRPLKPEEKDAGLVEHRYARIGIVIGAHEDVKETDITGKSLTAIYSAGKAFWADGKRIIVLARESGDSSMAVVERVVPGFQAASRSAAAQKRWEIFYTDQEAFAALRTISGSLGWADTTVLGEGRSDWHPLSFQGVAPTLAHLRDGTYPLVKDLTFVYKEPLPAEAAQFLAFCDSEAGREIRIANGAL